MIFLNDPYAFEEINQMRQFKSIESLVNLLSEILDEELDDVNPNDYVEKTAEVNGRARVTLKLCHELLGKALDAIDD